MKKIIVLLLVSITMVGCMRDSQVVSHNLSKEADQFRIRRRIVFYNSITDTYMFEMRGNCSINVDRADNQLEVTMITGINEYKKHYLGLSDNVTYFVEQIDHSEVSKYQYELIFKPKSLIPITIDVE